MKPAGRGNDPAAPVTVVASGEVVTRHELQFHVAVANDKTIETILKRTLSHADTKVLTAPKLVLFSGKRGCLKIVTETAYIRGYKKGADTDGAIDYEPVVARVEQGIAINVTGTVSADRKNVTLAMGASVST